VTVPEVALAEDADAKQSVAGRSVERLRAKVTNGRQLVPAPDAMKATCQGIDRRPLDADHVVPPTLTTLFFERRPLTRKVDAAGKADVGIDDENLSVVPVR
jgi:hypothetical protein